MKSILILALAAIGLTSCATLPDAAGGKAIKAKYSGVHKEGSDVTEPRPRKSKYLETVDGGVVVVDAGAGLFLDVVMAERPTQPLHMKINFENPGGGVISDETVLTPDMHDTYLSLSVPRVQSGLKSYKDYTITIQLRNSKEDSRPVDTLTQKVRSYVDTTGPVPRAYQGMRRR